MMKRLIMDGTGREMSVTFTNFRSTNALNQNAKFENCGVAYCTVWTVLSIALYGPSERISKMTNGKMNSRQKILAAAAELAGEVGPGHLSLDAVAQRAGVSKGGLLYNFPSKAKLLEALVEQHLSEFNTALEAKEKQWEGRPNSLGSAYLELFVTDLEQRQPPPSGLLAAMAEDPGFLMPIKRFNRTLLDRLKAGSKNENSALILFLALEGMRSQRLFDVDILSTAERDAVIASLGAALEKGD
ncbi:TetR/AcrR family transcriptional regulator [Mesorhizobium sp. YR577]|jgi:AcrR family transcriptional regulator|uniref:TetR/AcrR family transcriptional regulator n=1 Tax=unclassified Mesorhizobium TaxID=325217 RepID=UPI003296DA55